MTLQQYIDDNISKTYNYENNEFEVLYLDITSKCNMKCNICYNSQLGTPNVTTGQFQKLFDVIPSRRHLRFLGGEPTLHPNFFELISLSRKHGHIITVSSNGLMYADDYFMKELTNKKYNNHLCGYGITLNGGFTNHDAYKIIDNSVNVFETKMIAFENLIKYKIKNISPSAIILKGLNEHVIREIVDRCYGIDDRFVQIRFRSEGQLGDYINENGYTTKDFIDTLFPKYLGHIPNLYDNITFDGLGSRCFNCCFDFKIKDNILIRQIEFGSDGSSKCYKRGYVDFERELIYPFFEYENLKTQYYKECV